ncbi:MAG: type VI secretion system-associated FHA domain protein TagH [Alphaproteobacteria bacterium]|nr:type VI secretion system-associated FHA domain protein TagH [Alphaproteobacteria bacterium]
MAASLTLRVVSAPPTERAPPPLTLAGGRATIGRRDGNSWVLPDASAGVSREHAVIEGASGGWQIVDKSANGTFVNGQNVGNGNAWPLGAGDSLRIGGYEIAVEMEGGQEDFGRPAAGPATIGGDSFDLGDLARPDFGAPRAAPRGPSPLDPLAEERPPELPPSNDLFGELGDNRTPLSSGGAMADPFNAPEQRGLGVPPAEPFGAPPSPAGSPFGGPGPDNWGTPPSGNPDSFAAPAPPPQRSAFTNAPDPLAALPDPFDQAPPSPDDRHVPMPQSPFALQPVALPNPTGPGPQQALPTDWDAVPSGGLSAPPAELDPIEAALAGLAPKTGSSQPVAPDPGLDRAFGQPPGPVRGSMAPQPAAARPRPQAPTPRPAAPPTPAPPPRPLPPQQRAPAPPPMAPAAPAADDWVDVQPPPVGDNLFGDANAGPPMSADAGPAPPIPTDDPFDGPSDRQPSGRISVSKVAFPPTGTPATPTPAKPAPVAAPAPAPPPMAPPAPPRRATPAQPPSPAPALAGDDLLRAFLDGAGIENLPANTDPATALRTLGASTRAIVSTLARLLEARRLLKGEFRISQTVVAARENNPLKFSADESEMLLVMLGSVRPGFQSGQAAVWDAGKDLEAHQLALLAAFRAVLDAVLARLSPEAIAAAAGNEGGGVFGRRKEAVYWEHFAKAYGEVKQDIGNTLAGRIGQIFAEAYERENSKKGGSR